eukprot:1721085-Pyramimonas_sp.AAC.1
MIHKNIQTGRRRMLFLLVVVCCTNNTNLARNRGGFTQRKGGFTQRKGGSTPEGVGFYLRGRGDHPELGRLLEHYKPARGLALHAVLLLVPPHLRVTECVAQKVTKDVPYGRQGRLGTVRPSRPGFGVDVRGFYVDVRGCGVDARDCGADVRDCGVDVRGYGVDVRGYDVDVRDCSVVTF